MVDVVRVTTPANRFDCIGSVVSMDRRIAASDRSVYVGASHRDFLGQFSVMPRTVELVEWTKDI